MAQNKIVKSGKNTEVTQVELQVAQLLTELEATSDFKTVLKNFKIAGVKEVATGSETALVVVFPFRVYQKVAKVQDKIISALSKKFSAPAVLVAQRSILDTPAHVAKSQGFAIRPRTRSLTSVQENILEDIVGSNEIVGKRTRYTANGSKVSKVLKVLIAPTNATPEKFQVFAAVYKKLTNKDAVFQVVEKL